MNFRIASLLLATTMTTVTAASSKAYRVFSVPLRPKAGKAASPSDSSSSVSEESFITGKSSKILSLSSASLSNSSKAAKSKAVKCIKTIEDDQSVSLSVSTTDIGRALSASLSMPSKAAKSKMAKCLPTMMSVSMSIETAMPTYYPTYAPTTASPTGQPTTRRPTQRMVCQSGDYVDSLGRDCFWYESPNVEQLCESLRDDSGDVDLTNGDGKTPWDECCFCGGGTMVPESTTPPVSTPVRNLEVQQKMEVVSVTADLEGATDDTNNIVCISGRDFVDPLGRDCFFYVPENIEQGCDSLRGQGDLANEFSWTNEEGLTPWDECCFCGGGTLGYEEPALVVQSSA